MKKAITIFFVIISVLNICAQENHFAFKGEEAFRKGSYLESIDYFTKAIEENDSCKYNYYMRGLSKYILEKHPEAIADFTIAIKFITENISTTPLKTLEMKSMHNYPQDLACGWRRFNVCVAPSIKLVDVAISLEHHYFEAYLYRGISKYILGDYRGAIRDFDIIKCFSENVYLTYYYSGISKLKLKYYEEAINDLNKAISIDNESGLAYYYRGVCYLSINATEKGCLDLSKAGEFGIVEAYGLIKEYCNN